MDKKNIIYIFINVTTLFIWFILINFYLFAWNDFLFLLIISLIFLAVFIYLSLKQKSIYSFIIPIFVIIIYFFSYWLWNYDKNTNYDFLSINSNYKINGTNFQNNLRECLENTQCDLSKAFEENVENTKILLNSSNSYINTFALESYLTSILENKNLLVEKWIWNDLKLNFDKDKYSKNVLNWEYNNLLKSTNSTKNNLFFSKTSFENYSQNYFYDIYNSLNSNSTQEFSKKYKSSQNILSLGLNRKNLYNYMLNNSESQSKYATKLNNIENLVNEINL